VLYPKLTHLNEIWYREVDTKSIFVKLILVPVRLLLYSYSTSSKDNVLSDFLMTGQRTELERDIKNIYR